MVIRRVLCLAAFSLILGFNASVLCQSDQPVSAADVMKMTQAGLSDQLVIAQIRQHNKPANLSTDDMIALKKANVSDAVIAALIDPSAATAGQTTVVVQNPLLPSTAPSGATSGIAGDPNDPMSPHESGIYVYTQDHAGKSKMIELERTAYQGAKTGGMFASGLTYGIVKAKSKAIIQGKAASIRVGDPEPVFYFYFDDKAGGLGGNANLAAQNISNPNQFALIRLNVQKTTREAEIGEFSIWGASSGNNKKDLTLFKSERIKPGLYKVTVSDKLKAGEYCFMTAPTSTSSYSGMAGVTAQANLFDFGVDQ